MFCLPATSVPVAARGRSPQAELAAASIGDIRTMTGSSCRAALRRLGWMASCDTLGTNALAGRRLFEGQFCCCTYMLGNECKDLLHNITARVFTTLVHV